MERDSDGQNYIICMDRGIYAHLESKSREKMIEQVPTRGRNPTTPQWEKVPLSEPARHRWELPVLHYHKILVIYPYPFFGGNYPIVFLHNIINDCIRIITGSPR